MRLMEGYADVSGAEPLPFLDEWTLCRGLGWSWEDCLATPGPVREMFLLCLSVEAGLREKHSKSSPH